ncbi:tail fiber assembly protein [Paraburkholderia hospita]|nr:tail fiber assembly protein [Paraburkholderia hospita]
MLIHQYDATDGRYISSRLADVDPKNIGRWLVPAFSTDAPLPTRAALQWPFFVKGAWILKPDYRGVMLYRTENGEPAELLMAGVTPEEAGLTLTPRPSSQHSWIDGKWELDPAIVAANVRASAMAEFEARMAHARDMNAGKSDAYASGLLSREESYYFRAWSKYQLDLVRVVQRPDFPASVVWPADPVVYEEASAPAMAEYATRIAKAATFTDGKADDFAAGKLSDEDAYNYRSWTDYADLCARALDRETFPFDVKWPDEPVKYVDMLPKVAQPSNAAS